MSTHFSTVGSELPGVSGGAFVFSESSRLMFNCPEGMQRFSGETKIRLPKLSRVLFTRINPATIMGFPGFLFTINDSGIQALDTSGPSALTSFWKATQTAFFKYRRMDLRVQVVEGADDALGGKLESWKYDNMNVSSFSTGRGVLSYIVETPPKALKFNPEKAAAAGVKKGPKFALLKQGTAVASDKDPERMVQPHEVVDSTGADEKGGVLFLDVDDAVNNGVQNILASHKIHTVVHLTPLSLSQASEYGAVLNNFPAGVRHFGLGNGNSRVAFPTALVHRFHLNLVAPELFPMPDLSDVDPHGLTDPKDTTWAHSAKYSITDGTQIDIGSSFSVPTADSSIAMLSPELREVFITEIETAVTKQESGCSAGAPAISFLGTGSAIPSKYRNVSCTLVEHEGQANNVLLDCGEGSLGQLSQLFGDKLQEVARNVSFVFISHTHADHNLGLVAFLEYRRAAGGKNSDLLVLMPSDAHTFFTSIAPTSFEDIKIETYLSAPVVNAFAPIGEERLPVFHEWCKGRAATGCVFPVDHPANAHAMLLRMPGFSWIFSGDTRPSTAFASAARGEPVDILIHEATFSDDLKEEAIYKKHSTFGEAIDVAASCRAKHLLLTHFSQRYPKQLVIPDDARAKCCFAFDCMRIPLSQLDRAPRHMDAFQKLLTEYEAWGDSTSKRMRE